MRSRRKPPTREQLVARLDAACERASRCRVALRLAERAMVDARERLERFDTDAARPQPPVPGGGRDAVR